MKKTTLFAALAVMLCGLFATSCGERAQEILGEFMGPQDTWCKYEYTYKAGDESSVKLNCYLMYSDDDYKYKKGDYDIAFPAGLTIVIAPNTKASNDAGALATVLGGEKNYIVKTYGKGSAITADGEENEEGKGTVKIGALGWNTIYNVLYPEALSHPPVCLSDDAGWNQWGEGDTTLKSILKKVLIVKLLEKL